jgi:hypothetical protein
MNIIMFTLFIPDILRPLNYVNNLIDCHSLTRGGKSTFKICNFNVLKFIPYCVKMQLHIVNMKIEIIHICVSTSHFRFSSELTKISADPSTQKHPWLLDENLGNDCIYGINFIPQKVSLHLLPLGLHDQPNSHTLSDVV